MGNIGSSTGGGGGNHRRRHNQINHHHHQQPPQEAFVSSTPYHQPPPPPPFPYGPTSPPPPPLHGGYYNNRPPPPPSVAPMPLPAPYDPHHRIGVGPHGYPPHPYPPFPINFHQQHQQQPAPLPPHYVVEHQKAVTIKNNVNLKKETLSVVPDPLHPGKFLVSFTYDANTAGSITVLFFAKEGSGADQIATKECFKPVTISFEEGLGQKFCQPSGSGIDFSMFEESELIKEGDSDVYPLVVKADESSATNDEEHGSEEHHKISESSNSQITQAVFQKSENGEYHVRVVKQILWVKGVRYELQEIYGIGNSVEDDFDGNDVGKECVICLSEPRDTTALPCRHLCMCSECAKLLRLQTNRCPICRQPVDRFLEIEVRNDLNSSDANNNKLEEKGQQHDPSPPELSV